FTVMDTFVIPLSEGRGGAAPAACGGGAAGPCPFRKRGNMGCLLSPADSAPALACFFACLICRYAPARAVFQSRGSCGDCLTVASQPWAKPPSCHCAWSFPALMPGAALSVGACGMPSLPAR